MGIYLLLDTLERRAYERLRRAGEPGAMMLRARALECLSHKCRKGKMKDGRLGVCAGWRSPANGDQEDAKKQQLHFMIPSSH